MGQFSKTLVGHAPPRSKDSIIPPPPQEDALRPSRPPRGVRTPAVGASPPDLSQLPSGAPSWMKRARRLVVALESAIDQGVPEPHTTAAIERAWAAFELGGVSDAEIARVAHLCTRAHAALQERLRISAHEAYLDAAQVIHHGLPTALKKKTSLDQLVAVTKDLRRNPEVWSAVVEATAKILGWQARALEQAAHAIRVAIETHGVPSTPLSR